MKYASWVAQLAVTLAVTHLAAAAEIQYDANVAFLGAKMRLAFSNLEPNHRYTVRIDPASAGYGFTGSSMNSPIGLQIAPQEIDFVAPPDAEGGGLVSEQFTVGVFLPSSATLHSNVEIPSSLAVELESPSAGNGGTYYAEGTTEIELGSNPAPFGCLGEEVTCSLTQACPVRSPPVHCYGPIIGRFYCCRSDPFPP